MRAPTQRDPAPIVQAMLDVPYVAKGRGKPSGWDCWGCVVYGAQMLFDRAVPDFGHLYVASQAVDSVSVDALITPRLADFVKLDRPEAGSIGLFRRWGRASHVGLFLNAHAFIHCAPKCDTQVADVTLRPWAGLFVGAYVSPDWLR